MFSSESWLSNQQAGFYNGVATQSLRFDSGSSAYLSRTPSVAGNQKTWTFSSWIKRANANSGHSLISAGSDSSNWFLLYFPSTQFSVRAIGTHVFEKNSTPLYRDSSAWYHVIVSMDTTQATAEDRAKVWINNQRITAWDANTIPAQNSDTFINSTNPHNIGRLTTGSNYQDGYLAETILVDGQALDPTSFGETKNGVWIPIEYTGSYGTNGFRLQFNQTGTGTASSSTIGADTSGNDNHFSSSGIVASDCDMPDSPENNFATLNSTDLRFIAELLEGNTHLRATTYDSTNWGHSICTFPIPTSGKWYVEVHSKNLAGTGNLSDIGIIDRNNVRIPSNKSSPNYSVTTGEGFDGILNQHSTNGEFIAIKVDGTTSGSNISVSTSGDTGTVSALAIDVDNGYLYVGVTDGTGGTGSQIRWLDYADGSTGTSNVDPESGSSGTGGIARTFTNNDVISVGVGVSGDNSNKSQAFFNAGQDSSFAGSLTAQGNTDANGRGDFYYEVPDGYLALCTANLPEPTISPNADTQADDYFNTVIYTGNGTGQSITGVGFQSDWTWIKRRSATEQHWLTDSVRGVTKGLYSNLTNAEATRTDQIQSFDTDGFTLGNDGAGFTNVNANTYVSWNWKAGGTAVSNTDGSITSSVSANTDAGFSIVTYTGNSTAGATVGHGLSQAPDIIINKNRGTTNYWNVYTSVYGGSYVLYLNDTSGIQGSNSVWWNGTDTSSTVFTLGSNETNNATSNNYISYCFHSVEGYSKFGSYTGNGSTDGTFVYTGFRPAFVLFKRTDTAGNGWGMKDTVRDSTNPNNGYLFAESNGAEGTATSLDIDFLSNGLKFRGTSSDGNASGGTYIYMSFAENPFKYSLGR